MSRHSDAFSNFLQFSKNQITFFHSISSEKKNEKGNDIKTNIILIKKYILYQCVLPNKYNSNFSPKQLILISLKQNIRKRRKVYHENCRRAGKIASENLKKKGCI